MRKPPGEPPVVDENAPIEQRLLSAFFRFVHTPWHIVPAPGLTRTETGILMGIDRSQHHGKPLRVRDLSKIMRVSSPTATQHLNKLEEQGFVRREQSKDDRREVLIVLTDKGLEELEAHRKALDRNLHELIEHLGAEGAERLLSLLTKTSDFYFEKEKTYRD